jgi:hypothetical protein
MKRSRECAALVCWVGLAALAAGCQAPQPELGPRPGIGKDPCAERLHDLCGGLLLYHSMHARLPATLEELKALGSATQPQLTCPVSGMPYIYSPDGLRIPGRPGRLVLYDAAPSHSGMRWGVLFDDPGGGRPLTARVILLTEESVSSASTQPLPRADPRD